MWEVKAMFLTVAMLWLGQYVIQIKGPFSSKSPTASSRKYNMSPRQLLLQAKRREGLL